MPDYRTLLLNACLSTNTVYDSFNIETSPCSFCLRRSQLSQDKNAMWYTIAKHLNNIIRILLPDENDPIYTRLNFRKTLLFPTKAAGNKIKR